MNSSARSLHMIFFDIGETLIRPRKLFGDLLRETALAIGVHVPEAAFNGLSKHRVSCAIERTHHGVAFTFPVKASQRFWFDTYYGSLRHFLDSLEADRLTHRFLELLSSPEDYELYSDMILSEP